MISKVVWQMETKIPETEKEGLWVKKNGCIGITDFILFSDTKSLVKCRLDNLEGDHPEWYIIYRKKDGSGERAGDTVLFLKLWLK